METKLLDTTEAAKQESWPKIDPADVALLLRSVLSDMSKYIFSTNSAAFATIARMVL